MATRKKPTGEPPKDHAARAEWYVEGVISGVIPAGKRVRQACERHRRDLARPVGGGWRYKFDPEKGARVCRFMELLPHTKGKWASAREKLVLQPWQCFLIVVLFGWVNRATGMRRFRVAYWEIPRKNGKSILAAGVGLYMAFADGEFGAEVYSGATTEIQAHEVWKPARLMIARDDQLREALDVDPRAKALVRESDESAFKPVIGKPGDGSSPHCAILDEYHEHDTSEQYDTMETGMGAREQPLMLVITTAGFNIAGPCHLKHDEVCKVLDGVDEDDTMFGCIFGADENDDWADPRTLIKANPNYGVSVRAEFLEQMQKQALRNPIDQTKFKTKHLNIWCNVLAGIMNMEDWKRCGDPLLLEEELRGEDCWFGGDFASKLDLCTVQRLYRREDKTTGLPHFYLFGRYWLPEAAVEAEGPNRARFAAWVEQGHLIATPGATVDFKLITDTIVEDSAECNPEEFVYDPHVATQIAQTLGDEGVTCVEFVQNPHSFGVPIDELKAAVADGRFHHDCNPVTTWCVSNTVGRPARKGLLSPVKQKGKDHQKIDGFVALAMAMARACGGEYTTGREDSLAEPIILR